MQEIERKFLVAALPDLANTKRTEVRQGYITHPTDAVEMRLRQKNDDYVLTFKSGEGTVRTEREAAITQAQFDVFWPETDGRRVEKIRWSAQLPGGLIYELDIFEGALDGLVLVEVEFDTLAAAQAFEPPRWFGTDVTDDKRYKNKNMAVNGLPA
ncbi:CYTH domain-containing protein [Epibacterium ulvae]|uniref:CYTH domain-containing protein n=1 Tax=Epibacterium ulvae TaxID=1156985 RepID=UPI001BFC7313|nr:CYTH domain-containing protein [Epibacterium ulvae]MBT8154356.1 CYTH domain-containing protein [Epibacterium ulvae]